MGNSNTKYFIIGLIFLAVLGLAGLYYFKYYKKSVKPSGSSQNPTPSSNISRSSLLAQDQFLLPEPTKTDSLQTSLPQDLQPFLITTSTSTSISKATYPGGKTGFHIEMKGIGFTIPSLMGYYLKFDKENDWKVDKGAYIDGTGFVNLENPKYNVQTISDLQQGVYSVGVEIVQK